MGRVLPLVKKHITHGDRIAAMTTCDWLIVADTSNFGGYAIVLAMTVLIIKAALASE